MESIAIPTKGISTMDLIRMIENPGKENGKKFPIERANYLRTRCASNFKLEFPDRKYSVNEIKEEGAALVYWEAVA